MIILYISWRRFQNIWNKKIEPFLRTCYHGLKNFQKGFENNSNQEPPITAVLNFFNVLAIERLRKDSNAYKDNRVRGSVYSDIQSTLKRNFGVRKYEEIKHQQADIALDIIAAYEPPYILKEKVNYVNSQLNLF